jgi:hydrogenase/urease accessory protein HupE
MNQRTSWPFRFLAVIVLFLLFPAAAEAHMAIPGVGDFVNGMAHPLRTPTHLLILIAFGLWLGQRQPTDLRTPMFVFIPVSGVALLITATGKIPFVYPPLLIGIALGTAILVVLEKPVPRWVCGGLFALAALAIGLDCAVETGSAMTVAKTLLGTWFSLVVVLFNLGAYLSLAMKRKWMRIGIRVMGSWITAITFLTLAFYLKK